MALQNELEQKQISDLLSKFEQALPIKKMWQVESYTKQPATKKAQKYTARQVAVG